MDAFDITYSGQPLSNYAYLSETAQTDEVCRWITAFGTGITGFNMVDVTIERVLHGLPKALQEKILSELEQNQAAVRNGALPVK